MLTILTAAILGAFGRRIAGGLHETWTGKKWGQPTRLFFGATIAASAMLAGADPLWSLALIPAVWVGTITGLFGGLGMGRGEQGYWRDVGGMTLHGVLSIILPCVWCWYLGYAWWPVALSGFLIGPAYEAGYRLIGRNPYPYPFNRMNWPMGLNAATEFGELFWGATRGVGIAVAVMI